MTVRTAFAAFALATVLGAPGVRAQEPDGPVLHGEVADLERCMAEAPDNPRSCAGRLADRCQDAPEGSTTPGIVSCLAGETELWDRMLNARYAETVKRTEEQAGGNGSDAVASLRDAQRKWIDYRDAECGRLYDLWSGGTIRGVVHASCMLEQTAGRAIELGPQPR